MIVPDVNLLVYAEIDAFAQHAAARGWWETVMNGDRQVGIPPVCLFGFIRVATNRRILTDPLPADDAVGRVERWLDRPRVILLTTDVQIAAYAAAYQGEVYSNDAGFGQFEEVPWVHPLAVKR